MSEDGNPLRGPDGLFVKGHAKIGGAIKGKPIRRTLVLKEALLLAAEKAGDGDLVAYLTQMAKEQPASFLSLLGRVLPLQLENSGDNPVTITQVVHLVVDTREQAEAIELTAIPGSKEPN